jgi:plastocyanin
MGVPYQKKYPFLFLEVMTLTVIGFLITLNFLYSQSSGQINSRFNIYENDIHKVRIQYPSDWKQIPISMLPSDSIARFIAPGTGGGTKPTGVLITIFQRPNDSNLDDFIDFFHKGRYAKQSDFTIVNSSETTLAGIPAREIILYEQKDNVLDPKSDLKFMRVYAFDNDSHKGYALRYYSEPGLFNRYLPIAHKMFDSFELTDRPYISSMAAMVNNTNISSTDISGNITGSDNSTIDVSMKPFAPSLGDGNNTISTATVIIDRGSSFPDNKRFYSPSNLTIQGNTTVTWTNNDTVLHTVTSGDPNAGPSRVFDSSLIGPNNQFNYTFSDEGQFKYYCTLHQFMTGTVTVTKQIQPIVTTPDELPKLFDVSIAEGSSFPSSRIFFAPPEINVAPNATVVWTNDDSIIHSVISGKPREPPTGEFDSGIIQSGNSFEHNFSKTGTYDYYSSLHPYMLGKVIVGLYVYNLQVGDRIYPISFLLTGDGNQLQKISLQTTNPLLEIRMASASAGNLTLVIPRALLDKVEPNGMDDAFGVVANRAVGFEETSTTPTSRTLVVQFDPGVNYIQILGTKSIEPKINQAVLPSSANTSELKTRTNMPETPTKSEVPLTEPKPPVKDVPSQSDGSTVSIVPGSSVPSNGKYFVPETTTVSKGDTVTWTNEDTVLHTVTSGASDEGNSGAEFDSSYLAAGKTFEHAFDTAGTFDYYCTLHPFMTGKVKVQ